RDRNWQDLVRSKPIEQRAAEELADRERPGVKRRDSADLRHRQAEVFLYARIDDGVTRLEAEEKDDKGDGKCPHPPCHRAAEIRRRIASGHVQIPYKALKAKPGSSAVFCCI